MDDEMRTPKWQNRMIAMILILFILVGAFMLKITMMSLALDISRLVLGLVAGVAVTAVFCLAKQSRLLPILAGCMVVAWLLLPGTMKFSSVLLGCMIICSIGSISPISSFLSIFKSSC